MKDFSKHYKKLSRFMKWVIAIVVTTAVAIFVYLMCALFGVIDQYQDAINSHVFGANIITFAVIAIVAITYIILSLYNLLSHRAVEDSRIHCLPFIMTPVFLIIENGLLHLFHGEYYQMTLGVFTTTVLGVVTFASLKFSFEITNKQRRFIETSEVKPDIDIVMENGHKVSVRVTRNNSYFCGVFIGKIYKLEYFDIKKTGNQFVMHKLFLPNRKILYNISKKYQEIRFKKLTGKNVKELINAAEGEYDIYLIFKDTQNYYYFAQLPIGQCRYNVIGVNEHMMCRLVYLNNKQLYKIRKAKQNDKLIGWRDIHYESMDWFKIPYNFHVE